MKERCLSIAFASLLLLFISSPVYSQSFGSADIRAQLVKDWERAKAYNIAHLNTMPVDKYNVRAADSTRTFAHQMLHLAGGNVNLMMTATGTPPPSWLALDLEKKSSAQNKNPVMYFVKASYNNWRNAI